MSSKLGSQESQNSRKKQTVEWRVVSHERKKRRCRMDWLWINILDGDWMSTICLGIHKGDGAMGSKYVDGREGGRDEARERCGGFNI